MEERVKEILDFYANYKDSSNASTGSIWDPNANVTAKNIATEGFEALKHINIDVQRQIAFDYISKKYGESLAKQYFKDIKHHTIYVHDESTPAGMPYCAAVSLYPYLLDGLKKLGGSSTPPTHTASYIGGMINLIFLLAGQFAGACAVPEFLPYMDHFLRKDYGDDYMDHLDDELELIGNRKITLRKKITDWFQQFVYSINQPAGSRNYQSPFTNIAYFDEYFFKGIFKDFVFPDGDVPNFETTKLLQKMFLKWFNKERETNVLTFPVETFNLVYDKETKEPKDKWSADLVAEMWSEGHSFFCYNSDSVDALSSCCRLKNVIEENAFSYTLGAGGIKTGSKRVISLNMNRIVQDWYEVRDTITFKEYLDNIIDRVHKYLDAWNDKLWDDYNAGLLTAYTADFIDLDKQYLTVGVIGEMEGFEFLSQQPDSEYYQGRVRFDDEKYQKYVKSTLGEIKELNVRDRTEHCRYNSEMVPAENAGVKLYNWDKKDGYIVPKQRICYNSYFFPVENTTYNVLDKMKLHGNSFIESLDGGSACHINLEEHLTKEQYRKLLDIACKNGCSYFTFNIPMYACDDEEHCGYVSKYKVDKCPKCKSTVTPATRIIGYLKKVSNFSEPRQKEYSKRYFENDQVL